MKRSDVIEFLEQLNIKYTEYTSYIDINIGEGSVTGDVWVNASISFDDDDNYLKLDIYE